VEEKPQQQGGEVKPQQQMQEPGQTRQGQGRNPEAPPIVRGRSSDGNPMKPSGVDVAQVFDPIYSKIFYNGDSPENYALKKRWEYFDGLGGRWRYQAVRDVEKKWDELNPKERTPGKLREITRDVLRQYTGRATQAHKEKSELSTLHGGIQWRVKDPDRTVDNNLEDTRKELDKIGDGAVDLKRYKKELDDQEADELNWNYREGLDHQVPDPHDGSQFGDTWPKRAEEMFRLKLERLPESERTPAKVKEFIDEIDRHFDRLKEQVKRDPPGVPFYKGGWWNGDDDVRAWADNHSAEAKEAARRLQHDANENYVQEHPTRIIEGENKKPLLVYVKDNKPVSPEDTEALEGTSYTSDKKDQLIKAAQEHSAPSGSGFDSVHPTLGSGNNTPHAEHAMPPQNLVMRDSSDSSPSSSSSVPGFDPVEKAVDRSGSGLDAERRILGNAAVDRIVGGWAARTLRELGILTAQDYLERKAKGLLTPEQVAKAEEIGKETQNQLAGTSLASETAHRNLSPAEQAAYEKLSPEERIYHDLQQNVLQSAGVTTQEEYKEREEMGLLPADMQERAQKASLQARNQLVELAVNGKGPTSPAQEKALQDAVNGNVAGLSEETRMRVDELGKMLQETGVPSVAELRDRVNKGELSAEQVAAMRKAGQETDDRIRALLADRNASARPASDPAGAAGDLAGSAGAATKTAGDLAKASGDLAGAAGDPVKTAGNLAKAAAGDVVGAARTTGYVAKASGDQAGTGSDVTGPAGAVKAAGDPGKAGSDVTKPAGDAGTWGQAVEDAAAGLGKSASASQSSLDQAGWNGKFAGDVWSGLGQSADASPGLSVKDTKSVAGLGDAPGLSGLPGQGVAGQDGKTPVGNAVGAVSSGLGSALGLPGQAVGGLSRPSANTSGSAGTFSTASLGGSLDSVGQKAGDSVLAGLAGAAARSATSPGGSGSVNAPDTPAAGLGREAVKVATDTSQEIPGSGQPDWKGLFASGGGAGESTSTASAWTLPSQPRSVAPSTSSSVEQGSSARSPLPASLPSSGLASAAGLVGEQAPAFTAPSTSSELTSGESALSVSAAPSAAAQLPAPSASPALNTPALSAPATEPEQATPPSTLVGDQGLQQPAAPAAE